MSLEDFLAGVGFVVCFYLLTLLMWVVVPGA